MPTILSGSTGIGENIISIEVTGGTVIFPTPLPLPTGSIDPNYPYTGSIFTGSINISIPNTGSI